MNPNLKLTFQFDMANFIINTEIMKTTKNLFAACTILTLTSCCSEFKIVSSDVPQSVITAFQAKYPSAANVEWGAEKTEGHLAFEAEFKVDGKRKEAYFKPDGGFLKEE